MSFSNGAPPEGYTCEDAVDATSLSSWSGSFADYDDLWSSTGWTCSSASGREVWFTAIVQPGDLFTATETVTGSDVVLHFVSSCSTTTCDDSTDIPESIEYLNDTGLAVTVWLIVEAYNGSFIGSVNMSFSNGPP
jgi:hypothetical protein